MRLPSPRHLLPALALAVLLSAGAVLGTGRAALPVAEAEQGDFAGLVDIGGGRRMYLECRGQGSPTVVLVSGYGNHGGVWSIASDEVPQPQVLPAVAGFTRVCTYDRPGTIGADPLDRSRSDPVAQPRTAEDAVADLHALLRAAQVPGPYVLAGHSLGGLLVRLYAATYPDEAVGLVLVDATSEQLRAALTPEQWALVAERGDVVAPELASYAEFERLDFAAAYDAMLRAAAAQPLRQMPLVVLSRGHEDDLPPEVLEGGLPPGFLDALAVAWQESQAYLAALLPDARQVIATEAGHYIQVEQPQPVIDAVRQVVTAVRDPGSWPPAASDSTGQPSPAAAQPTALLVSATNAPQRVLGSDGMEHLEYDLIITNAFTAPVTLTSVEVIAPGGRVLLQLEGEALAARTQTVFYTGASPGIQIPTGVTVAVVIDLVVPPGQAPARISHRVAYALPAGAPALTLFDSRAVIGPELTVDHRAPLVIAPPLRGPGWYNFNGCCLPDTPHRAARLAIDGARYVKFETFAIDWLRLQDGRLFASDGARNEQHFAFGAEIVSVADGTVVAIRDDMPDETPGQPPVAVQYPGDYAGNNVVVQIQPDVWAIYAHFQPASIAVRVGERVTTGQFLGRLGSSGNSDAPHLHFQLSDGPDVITANSLPFVFDRYTLAGTVDQAALAATIADPDAPAAAIVGPPTSQTGTYPLVLTVQDFP